MWAFYLLDKKEETKKSSITGLQLTFLLLMKALAETDSPIIKMKSFLRTPPVCIGRAVGWKYWFLAV